MMLVLTLKLFFFFISLFATVFYGAITIHNVVRASALKPKTLLFACLGLAGMITVLFMGYFH